MDLRNLFDVLATVAKGAGKLLPRPKEEGIAPVSNTAVAIAPSAGDSRDIVIALLCVAVVALSLAVVAAATSQRA